MLASEEKITISLTLQEIFKGQIRAIEKCFKDGRSSSILIRNPLKECLDLKVLKLWEYPLSSQLSALLISEPSTASTLSIIATVTSHKKLKQESKMMNEMECYHSISLKKK